MPQTKKKSVKQKQEAARERMSLKQEGTAASTPRVNETQEDRGERLTQKTMAADIARASDLPEKRVKRLTQMKLAESTMRANETPVKRETRLTRKRTAAAESLATEAPGNRGERLTRKRTAAATLRKSEPPEKRVARLTQMKLAESTLRANETPEKRDTRLTRKRTATAESRANEAPEQKRKRLEQDQAKHLAQRAMLYCKKPTMVQLIAKFEHAVKQGPVFVCTCCHRLLYRHSVVQFNEKKYTDAVRLNNQLTSKVFDQRHRHESVDKMEWICKTCHASLKRNKLPSQAVANNLALEPIPKELLGLNPTEVRLISKRILFMKMVLLPRGKQKKIIGPAVNIPTNLTPICTLLPRLPSTAHVVALKLKRKLSYKGHYMYQYIRPEKIVTALKWLKANNPLYDDVEINTNWQNDWKESDSDMWEALLNDPELDKLHHTGPSDVTEGGLSTSTAVTHRPMQHQPDDNHLELRCPIDECYAAPYVQLHLMARSKGFKVVDVPADGNCLFSAVSQQMIRIGHIETTARTLRSLVAEHMEMNPTRGDLHYRDFVEKPAQQLTIQYINNDETEMQTLTDAHSDDADLRWKSYLHRLKTGAWGENLAIQGLCEMLDCNIQVISTELPDEEPTTITPSAGRATETVYLGLINQFHYTALERIQEDANADDDSDSDTEALDETEQNKLRGLQYDSCLQPENLEAEDHTFSLAPGEGGKPVYILDDKHFEEMAYPTHYPTGDNGISSNRYIKLTPRRFFNQRLLNVDTRFAKDVEYLLACQYAVECKQVRDSASIMLRQARGRVVPGQSMNAAFLKNPANLKGLIRNDQAYKFLKNVRGSPVFWQGTLYDLLAYLRQKNIPAIFLTLSAADLRWPDVIQIIAQQHGITLTTQEVQNMSFEERSNWLRANPLTAARHFHHRIETFIGDFIKCKFGPLGEVTEIVIRIEFQARGSPHAHIIIWINEAPRLNSTNESTVTTFIDELITCAVPNEDDPELRELVQSLQTHVHSAACKKRGDCRFNFPKPPSSSTLIAKEAESDEDLSRSKNILKRVFMLLQERDIPEDITLTALLKAAAVPELHYHHALAISKRGNTVVLKRRPCERWINNYNPDILRAWKANMDIQFVTDAYACVMYVASYMMKAEKEMGELLKHVAHDCRGMEIKEQMKKIKTVFLSHREVSAQEAAYRLLSLPLKKMSSKVIFVNTDPKESRVSMMKPISMIQNMADDDEDLFYSSIVDRYAARPDSLENMCLAEFAANYTPRRNSGGDEDEGQEDDDDDNHADLDNLIRLRGTLGTMYKRRKEAVIRFHKHSQDKHPEKFFHGQIMLYLPWREEEVDLKGGHPSYADHYNAQIHTIHVNELKYTVNANAIQQAMDELEQNGPPEHAWANIAPGAEHDRLIHEEEGEQVERQLAQQDLDDNARLLAGDGVLHSGNVYTAEITKHMLTPQEYCTMMRSLNTKQMEMMRFHRKWCKDTVLALKQGKKPTPYHVFLSGSGGVGKSHLIKLIHHDTIKLLKLVGYINPDEVISLLTAPTGVAAYNISGMTLHSAFCLKPSRFGFNYLPLAAEKLAQLEKALHNMQLLIIDEISMAGAETFLHVHRRLCEIKGTHRPQARPAPFANTGGTQQVVEEDVRDPFGNVSVLAVGDLFQLPPVKQNHIFGDTKDQMANISGVGWDLFELLELDEIMRQKDDTEFAEMLNRIREAKTTAEDLEVLKSREITTTAPDYPEDVLHVFAENKYVNEHNTFKLSKLNTNIYKIKAIDNSKDKDTRLISLDCTPNKLSETGGLWDVLEIAVGAQVMLTVNVNVADGLVNGARGCIEHIDIQQPQQEVTAILVKFEDSNVGTSAKSTSSYRTTYPEAVPIYKHEVIIYHGRRKAASTSRVQFPLTLAWGLTIHKVQGLTVNKIVVSMKAKRFNPGQAYVAFSRVKSLSGLHILDFNPSKIKVDPRIQKEMERLRQSPLKTPPPPQICQLPPGEFLSIGLLNVRGYLAHLNDIASDSHIAMLDVIAFTETHLKSTQQVSSRSLGGNHDYKLCRQDRPNNQAGGGVMFLLNNKTAVDQDDIVVPTGLECLCKLVKIHTTHICIAVIYRPPSMPIQIFKPLLQQLMDNIPTSTYSTFVLGDFNEDPFRQPNGEIHKFMYDSGFQQLVKDPTTDNGTLLDHVYFNRSHIDITIEVRDTYYSDHDLVLVSMRAN